MDEFELDDGPDEFDELDKVVELARKSTSEVGSVRPKHYAKPGMIQLMIDEVTLRDVRTYQ